MSLPRAMSAEERAARAWVREEEPDADATTSVVAHGLLGNLAVIRGATGVLFDDGELTDDDRVRLLEVLHSQVDLMQGVLTDLVRGMPSQALEALDALRKPST